MHHPGFEVDEIEPTGAGDIFGATFVAVWLSGVPATETAPTPLARLQWVIGARWRGRRLRRRSCASSRGDPSRQYASARPAWRVCSCLPTLTQAVPAEHVRREHEGPLCSRSGHPTLSVCPFKSRHREHFGPRDGSLLRAVVENATSRFGSSTRGFQILPMREREGMRRGTLVHAGVETLGLVAADLVIKARQTIG